MALFSIHRVSKHHPMISWITQSKMNRLESFLVQKSWRILTVLLLSTSPIKCSHGRPTLKTQEVICSAISCLQYCQLHLDGSDNQKLGLFFADENFLLWFSYEFTKWYMRQTQWNSITRITSMPALSALCWDMDWMLAQHGDRSV